MKNLIKKSKFIVSILTVILIASCGQNNNSNNSQNTSNPNLNNSSSSANNNNNPEKNETKVSSKKTNNSQSSMTMGTYCYSVNDQNLTAWSQLEISENQEVTGEIHGSIHNEESSYYSSYIRTFEGTINNNQLDVDITTEIENDVQTKQDTWSINQNELITDAETLSSLNCDEYKNADEFFEKNLLSENHLDDNTNDDSTDENTSNINQYNPSPNSPITVRFAQGTNSTVIENSVVRGEQDIYLLGVLKNQKMTVNITSLEDNAVFDILTPTGKLTDSEVTDTEIILPESGNYQIVVGGTRGNATYTLKVKIE